MKALDFALEHNVHSMKLSLILENVELARASGDDEKATMIVKRLQRLKKVRNFEFRCILTFIYCM